MFSVGKSLRRAHKENTRAEKYQSYKRHSGAANPQRARILNEKQRSR